MILGSFPHSNTLPPTKTPKTELYNSVVTVLLLLLLVAPTRSQTAVDSLKGLLRDQVSDTSQVRLLNELGSAYTYSNTDSAIIYTERALSKAEKLDFKSGVAQSKSQLSRVLRLVGNYPKALDNGLEALRYYTEVNKEQSIAEVLTNLGGIYFRLQEYPKALDYYQRSLRIRTALGDEPGQASQFVGLGLVYENLLQYKKALQYYKNALVINRRQGTPLNTAVNLVNIGDLYLNQNEYEAALPYFFESLEINKRIDNVQGVASVTRHLAQLYQKTGDLERSTAYAQTSLEVSQKIKRKLIAAEASLLLSENYAALEEYQKAFAYYRLHTTFKDSIYSASKLKELASLENKYAIQQKEQELKIQEQTITLLNKDNKIERLWRNIMAVGLMGIALLGFLGYRLQRLRNRKNSELLDAQRKVSQKLKQLDEVKSQFFANISHEFRTPLTLIEGPIQQLANSPQKKISKAHLEIIQRNTNRLLNLVNQLLDLSKLESGNLELETTASDIYGFLRAIVNSFSSLATESGITYITEIPPGELWATFDKDKLEKVVYNLLSNAFKFSGKGAKVRLNIQHSNNELKIQLEDTGRGIAPEQLPYIFDRFYRADQNAFSTGTGIGLTLTKELITLMKGSIQVESQIDKGTTFTVILPLQQITDKSVIPEIKKPLLQPAEVLPGFQMQKMHKTALPTVLVVEDNADMRKYLSDVLSERFNVREAKHGKMGLKKALVHSPEIIITDVMMPEMDGMEFCRLIKENIDTSHIPVIILTAKAEIKDKVKGLETGADDYLSKPFDAKELLARTQNLIQQRQRLRASYSELKMQLRPKGVSVSSLDEKFMEQLHRQLENNYMSPDFGVPGLYRAMGMSRAQLQRKIRALCNETPSALLRNFRLKKAAQLIIQDADNISQIAYSVGFNSVSYFTKCFRAFYGTAPSLYQLEYPV